MKTRFLIVLLAIGSALAAAAAQPESFAVNGLKVIVLPNTATDIVASNIYFRGGVAVAGISRAGIERLALAVATRASKSYPKDKLSAELERMNTLLGSNAGPDFSSITMQCVKQNLVESWKIFTDVLLNPLFDSIDVERERERTLAAIRQVQDNPDQYLNRLALEAFYTENPYSIDPSGTARTVKSFTARDLQSSMKGRLLAGDMLLVVVGNTTRAEVEGMVRGSLGSLPQGTIRMDPAASPPRHTAPSVKVVERKLPTNYIMGLFPAPEFGSPESFPMTLGRLILGDRLFEEVRTKRSLSYAPGTRAGGFFADYAALYVTAVKPETTITVMMDEMKRIQNEPVSAKTLSDRKNVYITGYYLNVETNASQADVLARYELAGRGYEEAMKLIDNIRKVTPEEIQKVWKEYAQNLQFVIIGSPGSLQLAPFMF